MKDSAANEMEEALRALQTLVGRKSRPTRHDARRILLALGEILLEGREAEALPFVERLRAILAPVLPAWEAACRDELALACAEHVQSVDPKHLQHPRFDFAYVVEARRRLEMRLAALECLGQEADEAWLDRVVRADELLEPYLRGRP
jgi:hypothetical protein